MKKVPGFAHCSKHVCMICKASPSQPKDKGAVVAWQQVSLAPTHLKAASAPTISQWLPTSSWSHTPCSTPKDKEEEETDSVMEPKTKMSHILVLTAAVTFCYVLNMSQRLLRWDLTKGNSSRKNDTYIGGTWNKWSCNMSTVSLGLCDPAINLLKTTRSRT